MQNILFKQTAEARDNPAIAELPWRHRGDGAIAPAQARRVSADSFRSLTARLATRIAPTAPPAEFHPVVALPADLADVIAEVEAASPLPAASVPVAEEPPVEFTSESPAAPIEMAELVPQFPTFALPAFEPLGQLNGIAHQALDQSPPIAEEAPPVEPEAELSEAEMQQGWVPEELATAPAAEQAIEQIEPLVAAEESIPLAAITETPATEQTLAELLQQPVAGVEAAALPEQSVHIRPADVAFARPAPMESEPQPATDPFKVTQPFAERVVDTILRNVAAAVMAKPSPSDRAEYLAEVEAMLAEQRAAHEAEELGLAQQEAQSTSSPLVWSAQRESFGARADQERSAENQALPLELPQPSSEPESLGEIAAAIPPRSRLVRKQPAAPNQSADAPAKPAIEEGDEDAAELARSLLDMMSSGGSALPQERALAADTLLRLAPRIPTRTLISVVERLAVTDNPPQLLVAKLIRDPRAEIAAPLLERCMHITDLDLISATSDGDPAKLRMVARRRVLSPALTDKLIASSDPSVLLTLVRNPGAALSHEAYYRLAEHAEHHHGLLAPLTTRADLPAPVAFELFWLVPPELRRFIFSRFLTDSENLNKILKITLAMQNDGSPLPEEADTQFPDKELIEAAIDLAVEGKADMAAARLAEIGGICKENAERILSDPDGEPLAVLLKAVGYPRGRLAVTLSRLKHPGCGVLRTDRPSDELQNIFDTLSFNKARILLTYWDWYAQKSGPYAPHN